MRENTTPWAVVVDRCLQTKGDQSGSGIVLENSIAVDCR